MRRKVYTLLFICITGLIVMNSRSIAQCPGCVINLSCTANPAKPTICPVSMPDGIAMQAYNEDVSFYLPANFDDAGSGFNVDLDQLDVLNVTGLPYGLSFQTDASPSNIYYPHSNPPATEHGCAKICGTPLIPGNYIITVFVLAHVTVTSLGISQTSNTSFDLPITILPSTSSNNGFTISNPFGCAPLSTGFTANRHSNGNPNYHYTWNFGNGNQSNIETPPNQNYANPGNYVVTLHTQIDTLPYYFSALTINAAPDCNDSPFSDPDYYFIFKQGGNTLYTASYIDNTAAPVTFSFSPIQLANLPYTIETWEYDTWPSSPDDPCGNFTIQGYTAGTYTLTSGTTVITYTIDHPILNFDDTDTVKVFPVPTISTISLSSNDSICDGDSVMLGITPLTGCTYQWYRDTSAINNATADTYMARSSGIYYCEVTNSYGCRGYSNNQKIVVIPNPPKPTFWIVGNTLNTNVVGYSLQWFFEGNAIPGANSLICDVTATGNYNLIAWNSFGCTSYSDTVLATYFAVEENAQDQDFNLFPNPNRGSFAVEYNISEPKEVVLQVSDLLGKIIYEENLGIQTGNIHKDIDLNPAANGTYIMTVSAGGRPVHKRMIIN